MKKKGASAPNAYMLFSKSKFAELKAEHPGASVAELATMLGKVWNEMSDSDKAVITVSFFML